jgi:ElaB/YqjD/DUF883 family membrane-anchored ribosome-binding protein
LLPRLCESRGDTLSPAAACRYPLPTRSLRRCAQTNEREEIAMADASSKTAGTSEANLEALRADMDRLRADLATIARTLTTMADAAGDEASERLREAAKLAQREAERASASVQRAVTDQPLVALAVTFITGLLIGLLFGRR